MFMRHYKYIYIYIIKSFRSHYGPGVDSASNRNEYQEYFLGVKAARCVRLTTLPPSCAVVTKSGSLNFLEPSGPFQACNGTDLNLLYIYIYIVYLHLQLAVCIQLSFCPENVDISDWRKGHNLSRGRHSSTEYYLLGGVPDVACCVVSGHPPLTLLTNEIKNISLFPCAISVQLAPLATDRQTVRYAFCLWDWYLSLFWISN